MKVECFWLGVSHWDVFFCVFFCQCFNSGWQLELLFSLLSLKLLLVVVVVVVVIIVIVIFIAVVVDIIGVLVKHEAKET